MMVAEQILLEKGLKKGMSKLEFLWINSNILLRKCADQEELQTFPAFQIDSVTSVSLASIQKTGKILLEISSDQVLKVFFSDSSALPSTPTAGDMKGSNFQYCFLKLIDQLKRQFETQTKNFLMKLVFKDE